MTMIKRPLTCMSFLGLTLSASLLAAPLFQVPQTPGGAGNPEAPQPKPERRIMKEARVAAPDRRALCLAISPDGGTLAAGCSDQLVYLLGPLSGEKRITLAGVKRGYVRGVAFVPAGKTIAAISDDHQLRLWDTASGRMLNELRALGDTEEAGLPQLSPIALAVSPEGGLIAVGGAGTLDEKHVVRLDDTTFFEVRVRDTKTHIRRWSHLGRRAFLVQLAFSPDGKILAGDLTDEVRLWDASTGDLKQTLKPNSGRVWSIAFSPDNRLMAGDGISSVDGRRMSCLTLWDVRTGAIVHSIEVGEASSVATSGTLAFSPDGKRLASTGVRVASGRILIGGRDVGSGQKVVNNIKLWDVTTGALVWTSAEGDLGHVQSLVFSPDGRSLYCCDDSAITRVDAGTGQTRKDLMRATDERSE
jgi:WD40 repeat protein